jgi:hypothetical protein
MSIRYEVLPIPAIARFTRIFEAGAISFGIEYRRLNEQIIAEEYGADARAKFGNVTPDSLGDVIDEDGISVHVFGTEDGQEYLRFDCFEDYPHYHYLEPQAGHQTVIEFDSAAHGPMVAWVLAALRSRLPEMLVQAGAVAIAERVDRALVEKVLVDVACEIDAAIERGEPTPVAAA